MALLSYPKRVVLGDIRVRDGLQHEEKFIPTNAKVWLAEHLILLRHTMRKRLRAKLQGIKHELRRRLHAPIADVGRWLRTVLRGHYNYYGVRTIAGP